MASVRHGYRPSPAGRRLALAGTGAVCGLLAVGVLVSFEVGVRSPKPTAQPALTVLVLASPSPTPPKPRVVEKSIEKHERRPTPPTVRMQASIAPLPTIAPPPPVPVPRPPDPAPPQPREAAPRTAAAPPAPQVSSDAPDSWEGRVLARLEKFRRYPGVSRDARGPGVVYVRFRMNRDGHVLTSSLARSSGYPALDRAALETL